MREARILRAGLGFFAMLVAVAGIGPRDVEAATTATKCRATIVKEAALYVGTVAKARAKCQDASAAGKVCDAAKVASVVDKATTRLRSSITRACGGKDKICGVGGFDPDVPLAAIGWNIGTCAGLGDGTCTSPIDDCGDVAECVACIGHRAIETAFPLFYPPGLGTVEKPLRSCVRNVGKSGAAVLVKLAARFGECWLGVNEADSGGSFSCPSSKTLRALAKLQAGHVGLVCDKCGGPSGSCGGVDDVAPAAIGFPSTCPGTGACTGPIDGLRDLASCTDCILGGLVDRTSRSWIPAFASPPPAPTCVPGPSATPIPTATP